MSRWRSRSGDPADRSRTLPAPKTAIPRCRTMFILSAFADEISPDPREQVAVLKSCNVRHIEFRSIHKTNVLALSGGQVREFKKLLDGEGFKLSAIGSPVGKLAVD